MAIIENLPYLQKKKFMRLSSQTTSLYKDIRGGSVNEFLMDFWEKQNQELKKFFIPKAPFNFLSHPIIRNTMFVSESQGWVPIELPLLKKIFDNNLVKLSKEDRVGGPEMLSDTSYLSSANTIHHLYHLAKYEEFSAVKIAEIDSVVEWGGGYGNMAKLYKRLNPMGSYTIIDTDLFCTIQWLYLTTLLPIGSVNIVRKRSDVLVSGKINILPLKYLKSHIPNGELFVSTWGLSESTITAQDFVLKKRWFGASRLLIGYQKSTTELSHASRLGKIAKKEGAEIIETPYIKNNYYALK